MPFGPKIRFELSPFENVPDLPVRVLVNVAAVAEILEENVPVVAEILEEYVPVVVETPPVVVKVPLAFKIILSPPPLYHLKSVEDPGT